MRNGAVGSSWNADRKTVKVKPHITKKRGEKSRSDMRLSCRSELDGDLPIESDLDAGCRADGGVRLLLSLRALKPRDQRLILQHLVEIDLEQRHARRVHVRAARAHECAL